MSCLCSQHEWSFDSTVNILYRITMIIGGVIVMYKTFAQPQPSLDSATQTQSTTSGPDEVLVQQEHHCPIAAAVHESIAAIHELIEKTSVEKEKEKEKAQERVPVTIAVGRKASSSSGSDGSSSSEHGIMRCGRSRSELRHAFGEPEMKIRSRSTEPRGDEDVRRRKNSWLKHRPSMKARC